MKPPQDDRLLFVVLSSAKDLDSLVILRSAARKDLGFPHSGSKSRSFGRTNSPQDDNRAVVLSGAKYLVLLLKGFQTRFFAQKKGSE